MREQISTAEAEILEISNVVCQYSYKSALEIQQVSGHRAEVINRHKRRENICSIAVIDKYKILLETTDYNS
jgi:hypothetical protein